MSNYCEDCGTKKRSGICTNCNEELYINDYQMPELDEIKTSAEWDKKVTEQRKSILTNLKDE